MPWCHTCRLEYAGPGSCLECGGALVDAPAPERRAPIRSGGLTIVATLPAEEALLASGRLDEGGIPATLERAVGGSVPRTDVPFHVLVSREQEGRARSLLRRGPRGRDAHTHGLLVVLVVTAIALALSAFVLAARWFFSGSPLPR